MTQLHLEEATTSDSSIVHPVAKPASLTFWSCYAYLNHYRNCFLIRSINTEKMHLHDQMSGWLRYSVCLNSCCSPKTKRTQEKTQKKTQRLVFKLPPFRKVMKLHQAVPITTVSLTTLSCLGLILLTREDSKVFRVFSVIFFWYSISSLKKKFMKTLRGFLKIADIWRT